MASPNTILVLPDCPSVGPILDLLCLLSHQRLIRPFVWTSTDSTRFTRIDTGPSTELTLAEFLRSETGEFGLVRLITADGVNDSRGAEIALALESSIGNALARQSDGSPIGVAQVLRAVNVLAPAAQAESVPSGLQLTGEYGRWSNVLLMPEVQRRSDLAVAPVAPDHEYVAHVVCGLVTIAGLWCDSALDDDIVQANESTDHWHLTRTRSRVLHAPELPDIVIGRVAQGPLPLPHGGTVDFERVPADRHGALLDKVHQILVSRHHLDAVSPDLVVPSRPPRKLSIREFLRLVKDFFTRRLRLRVREEIDARVASMKRAMEERLNSMVGTGGLDFVIDITNEKPMGEGTGDAPARPAFLLGSAQHAEPALWSDLRKTAFGLLDGGPLSDELKPLLTSGAVQLVLGQRDLVVGSNEEGPFDLASVSERMADGQLVALLDRLGVHLTGARESAKAIRDSLAERLEALTSGTAAVEETPEKHKRLRAILRMAWRVLKILFVVALGVAVVWLVPVLLALAGVLLILWLVLGGILVLVAVVGTVSRMLVGWFRDAHQKRPGASEAVVLRTALNIAELQLRRFEFIERQFPDWHRIIQVLVHEPFGAPLVNRSPRMRDVDLHLPPSHEIRDGETNLLRREGVIAAVRRAQYVPGWLSMLYIQASELARQEYALRQPGLVYEPDSDRSGAESDGPSSRRTLRDGIVFGRARALERLKLAIKVHGALATGSGLPPRDNEELVDWLFSEQESGSWSGFLSESVSGTPAGWNAGFINHVAGVRRRSEMVERWSEVPLAPYATPALPSAERLLEGALPEFRPFNFRSWVIEGTHNVSTSELRFFSNTPTAAVIDLSTATSLWKIPDEVDAGTVELLDPGVRAGWGIPEAALPAPGTEIKPLSMTLPPKSVGEYAFLMEVDGEPLTLGSNVMKYRIRREAAPPNGLEIVQHCLQMTADATGVTFVFDGAVEDLQSLKASSHLLSIAWAFDEEYRVYESRAGFKPGETIGLGGPFASRAADGRTVITGGSAVLNSDMALPTEIRTSPSHAVVLLHELGHAMNLGHVSSSKEIMCPGTSRDALDTWGPGDRRGLDCARYRPMAR